MLVCVVPASNLDEAEDKAEEIFAGISVRVAPGDILKPSDTLYELDLSGGTSIYRLSAVEHGTVAIFTQHFPDEFGAEVKAGGSLVEPVEDREYLPSHSHDDEVYSVGFTIEGPLDEKKLSTWVGELLQKQGPDIFRMKGVLWVEGRENRVVFQGVHMLFDAKPGTAWKEGEERTSVLVFIGRNLDRESLTESLEACLA